MSCYKRCIALVLILTLGWAKVGIADDATDSDANQRARQILDDTGVQGGFVVHLGCGDGKLTAALHANDRYIVHGLETGREAVDQARKFIQDSGNYGPVSVDLFDGRSLPYSDNMVNLIVAENPVDVSQDELLRILAPRGIAYINTGGKWTRTVKPVPEEIDEWTHYMHDASGNAVAHDTVVGPPRHLQWIGSPRWSRHHDRMASMSALVSAGGRMFYIMDEGSRVSIQLPPKWKLIARDAFNGTVLWKQAIPTWHSHLWPLKSGPTQLARRLVTDGKTVFATLGLRAPVTALDAATGKTLRVYKESDGTEEIIESGGVLFLLVNRGESELTDFTPQNNVGDQRRVATETEFHWNQEPRHLLAIESATGRVLWEKESRVAPLTLCANDQNVVFHDGERVVCLDRANGDEVWTSPPAARRERITLNFGPRIVLYDNVVLYAGGDRKMTAYAVANGSELWSASHDRSGYSSPEDLLVVGGLVWSAPTTVSRDSGVFTGRDVRTGEVKSQFAPDVQTYWFHHRCYMAKATDNFLLPSRTGIEFVDYEKENWDIHHWVRGGCLYGIMPCNGLVYAPPHNCACYPEAKLYGFNALAPASATRKLPNLIDEMSRLEKGPAFGAKIESAEDRENASDWPTYRGDMKRSGYTTANVPTELTSKWNTELTGRLTAPVIAGGQVYVAQIDQHTVHALDVDSGETAWSYTAGGRVDSPPTVWNGRVLFGSADGWVYCLRATDGALIWRYRAAPIDRRLMAFEQLESVWPVHGSLLVRDGMVYAVAGRSNFLDGGLRFLKLNAKTGEKLNETIVDETDPEKEENIQNRIAVLNMPAGLPDVLSSDGDSIFMRSQPFDLDGNRDEIGPHSGVPAEQGSTQHGEGAHIFAPMGFLDDTWFHRSYWVYGRSFAGGHAGYYQAGKFAPAGRILVVDDKDVYGFGRKPEYYRWTTILEHQLFRVDKNPPEVADARLARRGQSTMIQFEKSKSLDPTNQPIAVEARIKSERPDGVLVARGGPTRGYVLLMRGGKPRFSVRTTDGLVSVGAKEGVIGDWVHLLGQFNEDRLELYVNGERVARSKSNGLIVQDPAQSLEIGADDGGPVGTYNSPFGFTGIIDEVRVYQGNLTPGEVADRFANRGRNQRKNAKLVLSCSFDKGDAADASLERNNGAVVGARSVEGKLGKAMRFRGGSAGNRSGGSFVKPHWTKDVPLLVRGMVLADRTLFIVGPPDVIDEAETFEQIRSRIAEVDSRLEEQEAALEGQQGAIMQAISAETGEKIAQWKLPSLPIWDGLAASDGRLFLTTEKGEVICFDKP